MLHPNCPTHDRLVLDLALGRLDDETADTAESVRRSCPVCSAWWSRQFDSADAERVDRAVASVFAGIELPRWRRRRGWMAVAAVMVMTLGAAALWTQRSPLGPVDPPPVSEHVAGDSHELIRQMSFETPHELTTAEVRETGSDGSVVAQMAFEPTSETDAVIEIGPSADPSGEAPDSLGSVGFETGDLSEWSHST